MKLLWNATGDNDRVVVSGLATFHPVPEIERFVASATVKNDLIAAWRQRSTIAIEKLLAWHLTEARNRARLSQGALAKALGRPQSFVAKIEVNRRSVHVAELVQLCAAMDQDACELLMTVIRSQSVREVLALMEDLKSNRTLQKNILAEKTS